MIDSLFQKKPFILKLLKSFNDIDTVPSYKLKHLSEVLEKHDKDLKIIKVAYHQYQNFDQMYQGLLKATNTQEVQFSENFTLLDMIDFCKENKLTYFENDDDSLIVETETFEKLSLIYSPTWCITKNRSMFKRYLKKGRQFIYFNFSDTTANKRIGFTLNHKKADICNNDNKLVGFSTFVNLIKNETILSLIEKTGIKENTFKEHQDQSIGGFSLVLFFIGLIGGCGLVLTQSNTEHEAPEQSTAISESLQEVANSLSHITDMISLLFFLASIVLIMTGFLKFRSAAEYGSNSISQAIALISTGGFLLAINGVITVIAAG